jgi:L-alanine-DL-glutamate epimerase-like enolase superfamily enzyme
MNFNCVSRELHPRRAFRISRGSKMAAHNVFLRLDHGGFTGYGEAAPSAFYNETWEGVIQKLEHAREFIATLEVCSVADIEAAWTEAWCLLAPSRAAQCALDVALWDWLARQQGMTVAELAWGMRPQPIKTFATIGLSSAEELVAKIDELRGFPMIKIKSDAAANIETIRYIRERTPALLAVDANCAWSRLDLSHLAHVLASLDVEFIEQPFPPGLDAALTAVALPLVADESCVTEDDVPSVLERFDGFNIKLVKCGGITPARRMVKLGRARGKKIMVGCMLESSALIAAGAVIAQRTDYADLDGAWLIGDDPFHGWAFHHGTLLPPQRSGLGVEPEAGLFA